MQQLLIWTPGDARLLWQLAELYNAAGKQVIGDKTIDHRVTAHKIYDILTNPFGAYKYRPRELLDNKETLAKDLQSNPPPPEKAADDGAPGARAAPNDDDTGRVSWRTLFIGLAAGLIVALFVSWQLHEIRRRAQRRAAAKPQGLHGRAIAGEVGDTRIQVGNSPIVPAPDTHVRAADKPTKS